MICRQCPPTEKYIPALPPSPPYDGWGRDSMMSESSMSEATLSPYPSLAPLSHQRTPPPKKRREDTEPSGILVGQSDEVIERLVTGGTLRTRLDKNDYAAILDFLNKDRENYRKVAGDLSFPNPGAFRAFPVTYCSPNTAHTIWRGDPAHWQRKQCKDGSSRPAESPSTWVLGQRNGQKRKIRSYRTPAVTPGIARLGLFLFVNEEKQDVMVVHHVEEGGPNTPVGSPITTLCEKMSGLVTPQSYAPPPTAPAAPTGTAGGEVQEMDIMGGAGSMGGFPTASAPFDPSDFSGADPLGYIHMGTEGEGHGGDVIGYEGPGVLDQGGPESVLLDDLLEDACPPSFEFEDYSGEVAGGIPRISPGVEEDLSPPPPAQRPPQEVKAVAPCRDTIEGGSRMIIVMNDSFERFVASHLEDIRHWTLTFVPDGHPGTVTVASCLKPGVFSAIIPPSPTKAPCVVRVTLCCQNQPISACELFEYTVVDSAGAVEVLRPMEPPGDGGRSSRFWRNPFTLSDYEAASNSEQDSQTPAKVDRGNPDALKARLEAAQLIQKNMKKWLLKIQSDREVGISEDPSQQAGKPSEQNQEAELEKALLLIQRRVRVWLENPSGKRKRTGERVRKPASARECITTDEEDC